MLGVLVSLSVGAWKVRPISLTCRSTMRRLMPLQKYLEPPKGYSHRRQGLGRELYGRKRMHASEIPNQNYLPCSPLAHSELRKCRSVTMLPSSARLVRQRHVSIFVVMKSRVNVPELKQMKPHPHHPLALTAQNKTNRDH